EIYIVDLGPSAGREVSGIRPVVIVSNDVSNWVPWLVNVLPAVDATDVYAKLGVLVPSAESGHTTDIAVLATQPCTLDPSRFTAGPVGTVPTELMQKISYALQVQLDL
ncbi:MAG: type II toxin-antitoxin system PemK/MazF family toxin, partial [Planctomycetes bacterium]|nr:type II toxin-antitoxin system PemK/MazF family toxin [Planctomycetota bacterium]